MPLQLITETKPTLSWWLFLLQFFSVALAFLAGSLPPVVLLGQTSTGMALSSITSMLSALVVAWLWVRREHRVREAFDLSRPEPRQFAAFALIGLGGTLAIFALGNWLVQQLGLPVPDTSQVIALVTESPQALALWIVGVAWFAAGFGEEMVWRGWLMDRLERLGGLTGRTWLVLVVQALLFGLPHLYQGWGGVIVTAMVGLLLGWIRIRQRGNLWAVIAAHAAVDTLMMGLAYAGETGLLE